MCKAGLLYRVNDFELSLIDNTEGISPDARLNNFFMTFKNDNFKKSCTIVYLIFIVVWQRHYV